MLVEYYSPSHHSEPTAISHRYSNPLVERLNMFVTLGDEEREAVIAMTCSRRTFKANETLVREGCRPDRICLIVSGVAYRYRYLANGRRQIFGYLLPGDLCDTQFVILNECDHNVGLLCDTEVATISLPALMSAMVKYPKIERALLMMSLVDAAMLREWLLNVGQRDAFQKLAHFFCELSARFHALGIHDATTGYTIPLTQIELADTMGLTVVHVNRILQRFRREGLVNWSRRHFDIIDYPQLEHLAGFDASYLRLRTCRAEPKLMAYG
ncbi:MAG: Crp/Fnr family transcriptional regulator [Pseudomonadota bacterium]|nr:Crp/Fnr family transcriptional regulator [Pseudomonadota bacterium]